MSSCPCQHLVDVAMCMRFIHGHDDAVGPKIRFLEMPAKDLFCLFFFERHPFQYKFLDAKSWGEVG